MEGAQNPASRKRDLQQISVPFLWEEKPGLPKQEWTPTSLLVAALPLTLLLPPPPPEEFPNSPPPGAPVPSRPPPPPPPQLAKLVVSVPFKWEEKPGTPLQALTRKRTLPAKEKSLALPPAYYSQFFECFESDEESSLEEEDEPDWLRELERDVYSRQLTVPAVPSSPESESGSSTSSYATGSTSPVGNSFLEQLFPQAKLVACSKVEANVTQIKALRSEGERSIVIRRPQTLGDLIMLSRRRSYLHKAAGMTKMSVSKEFEEPDDLGCFMFGSGNGRIAKLLGGKSLLSLKLA